MSGDSHGSKAVADSRLWEALEMILRFLSQRATSTCDLRPARQSIVVICDSPNCCRTLKTSTEVSRSGRNVQPADSEEIRFWIERDSLGIVSVSVVLQPPDPATRSIVIRGQRLRDDPGVARAGFISGHRDTCGGGKALTTCPGLSVCVVHVKCV